MKKNILILTTGLSGSSVVTGLMKQSQYWCGDKTEFKSNSTGYYETYENSDFVVLNQKLISLAGLKVKSNFWYETENRDIFYRLYDEIDLTIYKQFIEQCQQHEPWILKDPKLWITIGFWLRLLSEQEVQCIVLQRKIQNLWLSQVLKRIVYDYHYLKTAEKSSKKNLTNYLKLNNVSFVEVVYDDLINDLEANLKKLNFFLGTQLTQNDWNKVFQPNKRKPNIYLWCQAILIYLKNYNSRIKK